MVKMIPMTKARVGLGALVQDILKNKTTYILEKSGAETVAVLDAEELQDLKDTLEATQRLLQEKTGVVRASHTALKAKYGV
ncbi:MAG: 3-dehydroquinate synthase class II [Candidatus Azotimanducaceae bacterium]|jgi:3-dehydroquinate synthase class II